VAYLTDNLTHPSNYLVIKVDSSNRPLLELQQIVTPLTVATGTLTATGAITDSETLTIDGKTYVIQDVLTNVDGNVLKGATVGDTLNNLVAAINLDRGGGTLYAAATAMHSTVSAVRGAGDTLVVASKVLGVVGNAITTTAVIVNASWGGAVLAGGAGTTTTVAAVTPSYAAITAGKPVHIRLTWDSANPVSGLRYTSLSVNEETIPTVDWSTDPVTSWSPFKPSHLVLGTPLVGTAVFNGTINSVQLSEAV
jgi:hypothetical protein